jgi:hypothetical protein
MKEIRRTVDDHLPKWLNSKMLSAVGFIWKVKGDDEETQTRISAVAEKLDGEEMCWVMMLLTLPKLNKIIMRGEEYKDFTEKKKAERTLH